MKTWSGLHDIQLYHDSFNKTHFPVDPLQTAHHHVTAIAQKPGSMETPPYLKVQTLAPDVLEGAVITCIEAWGEYGEKDKVGKSIHYGADICDIGSNTLVGLRSGSK